ncbi:hypothetical protein PC116_g28873 [Phytophthora cactorum]|nr:hypothetical protein PC116_g28873 [Phytophthora cactorum]
MVELSINRPELHNHSWRSVTSVVKPDELHISGSEPDFWDRSNPVEVIVSHRVGCNGIARCDCASRGSRDTIGVPFPAASWANTFIKLAPYVTAERERRERRGREQDANRGSRPSRAERENARMKKEDSTSDKGGNKMPTPKELLSQVAMYQEIWSAPNEGPGSGIEGGKRGWTRRAVVLWTFVPVHDHTDEKGKTVTAAPGLDLLQGFDNGLVTPPPTASLTGGYPHNFDDSASGDSSLHHQLSFISDGTTGAGTNTIPAEIPGGGSHNGSNNSTDPFLSGLGVPVSSYEDNWAVSAQSSGLSLDTTSWGVGVSWADPAGGLTSATTSASTGEPLWASSLPGTVSGHNSRDTSFSGASSSHWGGPGADEKEASLWANKTEHNSHHHQYSTQQQQQDPWASWQAASADQPSWNMDAQDFGLDLGATNTTGIPHTNTMRSHQHQHPQAEVAGRKRSRADSVDADAGGDTVYPVHSMRKLSHPTALPSGRSQVQGQTAQTAPTAVMDGGQGYL